MAERQWYTQGFSGHVKKKETFQAAEGTDIFTIAEVESMGFKGVKKLASERGFLREGRYRIPGRQKIKRMNYVDRAGLIEIIEFFRARQGAAELDAIEKGLERQGEKREKALKRLREARGEG